ncbi:MAG: MFS transporter [Ignavibacteriales bacterium]|nr:MFS transporter [Ignavibacteriales bacterium]
MSEEQAQPATRREWFLLITLATIQFTNILDFVIMMPLGPQLMRVFDMNAQQFGLVVSAYTFSAGTTGLLAAFFIDRFDRRRSLLFLYAGFGVGTFLCAIAPSYVFLVAARMTAGAFGGILGATIFAIIGDVIPYSRRGAATGMIMSSFSLATVVGVPTGMYLANRFSWHAPFFLLAANAAFVWAVAFRALPVLRTHLDNASDESPVRVVVSLVASWKYLRAFVFMILLVYAGFSIIPYLAPFLVSNLNMTEAQLPLVYFFGGAATIFTSRLFGRLSDQYGKKRIFAILTLVSLLPQLILTNLTAIPIIPLLVLTTFFMVFISGRGVPAMALVTSMVEPHRRGSFMSLNTSAQQLAAGVASMISGSVLITTSNGQLQRFDWIGWIAALVACACLWMSTKLESLEEISPAPVASHGR